MYSMKEACELTGMTYENLKFYCKEGLVPNVKRDSRNYRIFDEHDIKWIQSLNCLKNTLPDSSFPAFRPGTPEYQSCQSPAPLSLHP